MRAVTYGESTARSAGVICQPSAISSRITVIMSKVVWKMTALVISVENFRIFSCSGH
jgi:hypothetical protein